MQTINTINNGQTLINMLISNIDIMKANCNKLNIISKTFNISLKSVQDITSGANITIEQLTEAFTYANNTIKYNPEILNHFTKQKINTLQELIDMLFKNTNNQNKNYIIEIFGNGIELTSTFMNKIQVKKYITKKEIDNVINNVDNLKMESINLGIKALKRVEQQVDFNKSISKLEKMEKDLEPIYKLENVKCDSGIFDVEGYYLYNFTKITDLIKIATIVKNVKLDIIDLMVLLPYHTVLNSKGNKMFEKTFGSYEQAKMNLSHHPEKLAKLNSNLHNLLNKRTIGSEQI